MVFEILVIEKPTKEDAKNGKLEKIANGPKHFVAADESRAMMKAAMEFQLDLDNDRLEVLVRPFA